MSENKHHPGIAAVLSFIFCGLGQLYNGQIIKGLIIIFFTGLSLLLITLGAVLIYFWLIQQLIIWFILVGIAMFFIGIILICIVSVYSIFDAYKNG